MRRRRVVFVGLVVVLAASLAVGTGADTVTYDDVDTLELQPAGEDNAYVDENGDGEIRIRVNEGAAVGGAGVNDDAVTDIGPVFTIENVFRFGDPADGTNANRATVWVDNDGSGAVTFYDTATGDPIETADEGVELLPDESTTVGLRVDTTGEATPTITTLTVRASMENLAFEEIEYEPGGGNTDLDVERDVTATAIAGDDELNVTEELTIEASSDTIEIDEGAKSIRTVNPEGRTPDSGWINVSVGDSETKQIEFDIKWRETDENPMAMEGGGSIASFQQLGVFDRIEFGEPVDGSVTVEAFEGMDDANAPNAPNADVIQAVNVTVPGGHEDTNATLVFTLDESNVETNLENLVVLHETEGGYDTLETNATTENGVVTVEAETSGFSAFVVADGESMSPDTGSEGTGSNDGDAGASEDDSDDADDSDGTADADAEPDGDEGVTDPDDGDASPDDGGPEGDDTGSDDTGGDADADGTSTATDSLLPTELGGLTLSPPWFLLALAAASLLLVFAYRRRREDEEA